MTNKNIYLKDLNVAKKKVYFYSNGDLGLRLGQIHFSDSKRLVYEIKFSSRKNHMREQKNRTWANFYHIYPDAKIIDEKEYLFHRIKYD